MMDLEALRQRWVDWASGKQGETCDEIFGEAMAEVRRLKAENEQLKERLEDVYLKDVGKTREINILTREYNKLEEALKEPEPERWGCCGAQRKEESGDYCPRCS